MSAPQNPNFPEYEVQTEFHLTAHKWAEFVAALEAPPEEIPALRALFDGPSCFDSPEC